LAKRGEGRFSNVYVNSILRPLIDGPMKQEYNREVIMQPLTRITIDPQVMGGKPCIRGMRVTVGTIVGLIACGKSVEDILGEYPYLEREDVMEALSYAAWRSEEQELPMVTG
jgi:uncharacterized protein (DUF433 family)